MPIISPTGQLSSSRIEPSPMEEEVTGVAMREVSRVLDGMAAARDRFVQRQSQIDNASNLSDEDINNMCRREGITFEEFLEMPLPRQNRLKRQYVLYKIGLITDSMTIMNVQI